MTNAEVEEKAIAKYGDEGWSAIQEYAENRVESEFFNRKTAPDIYGEVPSNENDAWDLSQDIYNNTLNDAFVDELFR